MESGMKTDSALADLLRLKNNLLKQIKPRLYMFIILKPGLYKNCKN